MDYPHVKGLARKRTVKGWRYILTIDHKSITVPVAEGDSEVEFLRKVSQARESLLGRKEKTLMDWLDEYATFRQLTHGTIDAYRRIVRRFSLVDDDNRRTLHEILKGSYKVQTKKQYVSIVRSLFSWMIAHGAQVANPALDCMVKGEHQRNRVLTPDEMQRLRDYAESWVREEPLYTIYILTMINTGARSSSALRTRWCDLDEQNRLHLYNQKAKKPYDYSIPIVDKRLIQLWRALETVNHQKEMYSNREQVRKRYATRLGDWMHETFGQDDNGEWLSPHSLRHTFATNALRAGVPLEVVSKLLDHRSPATTIKVYARFSESQIDDAIKKTFG